MFRTAGVDRFVLAVFLLSLLFSSSALAAKGFEVTFQLVPADRWSRLEQEGAAVLLKEGEIRLYRVGASKPEIRGTVGVPIAIPAGEWTWVGEAPGFLTTGAGVLSILEEAEGSKTLVSKVEPTCRVALGEQAWPGVERVDFVSLDMGAVFPSFTTAGQEMQIPAGAFLYYTSTSRGLGAISALQSCRPGEVLKVPAPSLPRAGRQDLMVIARGSGKLAKKTGEVDAQVRTLAGEDFLVPTAQTHAAGWSVFFFLRLPAGGSVEVRLTHPEMRTERQSVEPLGASARELNLDLRDRLSLVLPIDYIPKREHQTALVRLRTCGDQEPVVPSECKRSNHSQQLVEGLQEYRFTHLDAEQIFFEAEIDDEILLGLGDGEARDLREELGPEILAAYQRLEEHHVYGHLLLGGEPIAGSLRFEPLEAGVFSARTFPTDEDLFYHVFYFGQKQPYRARGMYPESLWKKLEEGIFGLKFLKMAMSACDVEGFCHPFHIASSLIGDGRWDIDLGGDQRWKIQVLDSANQVPIAGANVLVQPPNRKGHLVHVFDGEIIPPDRVSGEALLQRTNSEGLAGFLGLAAETKILVRAEGYEPFRSTLAEAGAGQEVTVELMALDQAQGLQLAVAGQTLEAGVIVILQEDGRGDPRCMARLLSDGFLYLRESCRANPARSALIASPNSQLLITPVGALPPHGLVPLPPRQGLPLEVRLMDTAGQPVVHSVGLRYQGIEISPDLLLMLSLGGMPQVYTTGADGVVKWPFLGTEGPVAELLLPELGVSRPLFADEGRARVLVLVDPRESQ